MNIFYKCACMAEEAEITVHDRVPQLDVADWMGRVVVMQIAADHATRSPLCRELEMEYAKIPLDNEDQGIGFPAVKH